MNIWFALLMYYAGQIWWIGSYEYEQECQALQRHFEEQPQYKNSLFACVAIKVEKT